MADTNDKWTWHRKSVSQDNQDKLELTGIDSVFA